MTATVDLLVVGYGNTLRRDDGVGPKVAEAVAAMGLPGVSVLIRHQLVPELADPVSSAGAVVFVDASTKVQGEVEMHEIDEEKGEPILAHAADPCALMALARRVFGSCPRAWELSVPVEDLSFGDGLSPRGEAGFRAALERVVSLAKELKKN